MNYNYDSTYGELSEIQGKYSSTVNYEEDITRDNLGRVSTKTENYAGTSHVYGYTYDPAGRLTTVTKDSAAYDSYSYDSNSNRNSQTLSGTTITPTYDGVDRLVTFGTKTYTFSGNGYLSSVYDSSTSGTTSYTYDALGNLKSVTLPSSTVINYTVDGENRRTSKATGSTINNYFVWGRNNQLLALLDSSGNIVQRYIYGARSNVPDYMVDGSGINHQFISDHLGSVVMVVNTSTGSIDEQIQYDEFGKVLSDSSPGYQPFGFAGGLYDSDTGLVRFGARDYDAYTGRWTNRDPILFRGGDTNLYGYVLTDPVNQTDPSGNCPLCVVGVGAAIGAISGVTGSYLAGTLNSGNIVQTAALGAAAGGVAVWTSGAVAAAAAATTLSEFLGAEVSSGLASTLLGAGIDTAATIGLNSPPGGGTANGLQKPSCP